MVVIVLFCLITQKYPIFTACTSLILLTIICTINCNHEDIYQLQRVGKLCFTKLKGELSLGGFPLHYIGPVVNEGFWAEGNLAPHSM